MVVSACRGNAELPSGNRIQITYDIDLELVLEVAPLVEASLTRR